MIVSDLKINDVFYMELGMLVNHPATLIAYLGMNKFQIDVDGIGMLVNGDDKVTKVANSGVNELKLSELSLEELRQLRRNINMLIEDYTSDIIK